MSRLLSCLFVFLLFFSFLVFGVVRAQPCEHARYPRTPLCSLFPLFVYFVFSFLCFSSRPAFLLLEWRCVWSPCVGVFGGHDGDRESVSFFLVFLVVACSAFAASAVAASAVAFGAEDSSVVRMVGSS